MIGTELGGYRIESELGRGATGTVYRACQLSLDRPVAVKVLHPALTADAEFVTRFRREATAIAQLNHPNIVHVFGIGEQDGALFYAMELVDGDTLKARLDREGRLAPHVAVRILSRICHGVHAAHRAGIIHRDLKPENIALTPDGDVKVMDFGTAHDAAAGAKLTHAGSIIGTPAFMSPEQAAGQATTRASDVYSLGVMLYEMLTGDLPFHHRDLLMLLQMHQWEEPVPPRAYVPTLRPALEEIVLKMLAKSPAERYDSCAAVLEDLRWVAKGQPERSSACGTRTTGAVGMDAGPGAEPRPAVAPAPGAVDPYSLLAACAERALRETARRRRVTLHFHNGGVLHGSAGRFTTGIAVLDIPEVGEVGLPLAALTAEPLTYASDEATILPRSREWAERFYEHWRQTHTVGPGADWMDEMAADAERALPAPPDPPHRTELAELAARWGPWSHARRTDGTEAATTPTGTAVLQTTAADYPDRVILSTGRELVCRVQEERPASLWVLRDDGRRVRVARSDVRCVFKNVPADPEARPDARGCPDTITLRSGRTLPCTILERQSDRLRIRAEDGRVTRLTFKEVRTVEWGGPADAPPESPDADAARTLEAVRTAYQAAVDAVIAAVAPPPMHR